MFQTKTRHISLMAVDVDQAKEILTASPKIPNLNPNGARGFIFPVELTSDKWCCSLAKKDALMWQC